MRLSKFLLIVSFVTFFAILYVWQQTEIFRLAYEGERKIALYQDMFDKNAFLRYNREKSASLIQIGTKFSKVSDFEMPDAYRLVRLSRPLENVRAGRNMYRKESLISRIFSIKRQAEAKTAER
ncbi:MAG: hypothetical protein NTW64_05560 [Candidatus Omnitrophica bacterium]|nr:hypothetical protein [Candidatus Omnitrophota bacterium]